MPKRLRLTRHLTLSLTEDAHRALRRFTEESGLTPDEALCFLFENFGSVTHPEKLPHRLRLFKAELEARKA
jgi:hypothetical protein